MSWNPGEGGWESSTRLPNFMARLNIIDLGGAVTASRQKLGVSTEFDTAHHTTVIHRVSKIDIDDMGHILTESVE